MQQQKQHISFNYTWVSVFISKQQPIVACNLGKVAKPNTQVKDRCANWSSPGVRDRWLHWVGGSSSSCPAEMLPPPPPPPHQQQDC